MYSTFVRNDSIDGCENWVWPVGDNGAWEGPRTDWINHHKNNIIKYVKNWDVVVQAGGCCGMYPRLLSNMFKRVYTFEPDPLNFHCLVNNCQKDNIFKFNSGLGNTHTRIQVKKHSIDNVGMHTVSPTEDAYTLQFRVDDLELEHLDLLMLDVEGYEFHIITGAMNSIEKFKPVIFAENGGQQILDAISHLGYRIVDKSVADTIYAVG